MVASSNGTSLSMVTSPIATPPPKSSAKHAKIGSGRGGVGRGVGGGETVCRVQGMSTRSWLSLVRMIAVSGVRLTMVVSACAKSLGSKFAIQRSSRKLMVASSNGTSLVMPTTARTSPLSSMVKVHSKTGSGRSCAPAGVVLASSSAARRAHPPVRTASHRRLIVRNMNLSLYLPPPRPISRHSVKVR